MRRVPPSPTTTIRRSACTCIFVRGRRPVAGWPHGRLIGLLDRDVPTTTTLLLLLCTGAHYSHKAPRVAPPLLRACNARVCPVQGLLHLPARITQAYATHSSWRSTRWTREDEQCGYVGRFLLRRWLAREVSTTFVAELRQSRGSVSEFVTEEASRGETTL